MIARPAFEDTAVDELTPARDAEAVLTFVTSLPHPDAVADYRIKEDLFRTTLASLEHQTDSRHAVVVVTNTPFDPGDTRTPVTCVTVDFPMQTVDRSDREARLEGVRVDRGSKLAVAVSRVRSGHVMSLDGDDFVHRGITEFVAARPAARGWYVEQGYRFDAHTGLCRRIAGFNNTCGTSLIFRRDALPYPELAASPTQAEVFAGFGDDTVIRLLGSHRHMRADYDLPALPMPAAVYSVNTGANDSRQGAVMVGRPLSHSLAAQYGMTPTRSQLAMWGTAVRTFPAGLRNHARHLLARGR